LLAIATGWIGLAACTTAPQRDPGSQLQANERLVADGRLYASLNCSTCHAVDREDFSPNPDAPPMKRLLPRLDFKLIQRSPDQGVMLSHSRMPPLRLTILDKEALTAYLRSISN
jgi:mono/diheme cytochrome c family protein